MEFKQTSYLHKNNLEIFFITKTWFDKKDGPRTEPICAESGNLRAHIRDSAHNFRYSDRETIYQIIFH